MNRNYLIFRAIFYIKYSFYQFASIFNLNENIIKKICKETITLFDFTKLDDFIKIKTSKNSLNIAFVSLGGTKGVYLDIFLAIILRKRGHKVKFFVEDNSMPLFEIHEFKYPE